MPEQQGNRQGWVRLLNNGFDLLLARFVDTGNDKMQRRIALEQPLCGIYKGLADVSDFAGTTAGQDANDALVRVEPKRTARLLLLTFKRNHVGQWMPDKAYRHLVFVIKTRLERKQRQHQIDRAEEHTS